MVSSKRLSSPNRLRAPGRSHSKFSFLCESVLPFAPKGTSNGGGGTAFLTTGPYKGNLLAVDEANRRVVRVPPPFIVDQAGIDFVTNLTGPVGLTISKEGNVFVSNTDGTIQQFGPDGTSLGLFATLRLQVGTT